MRRLVMVFGYGGVERAIFVFCFGCHCIYNIFLNYLKDMDGLEEGSLFSAGADSAAIGVLQQYCVVLNGPFARCLFLHKY